MGMERLTDDDCGVARCPKRYRFHRHKVDSLTGASIPLSVEPTPDVRWGGFWVVAVPALVSLVIGCALGVWIVRHF